MLHCPRAALKALKDLLVHRPKECVRNCLPVYICVALATVVCHITGLMLKCAVMHRNPIDTFIQQIRTEWEETLRKSRNAQKKIEKKPTILDNLVVFLMTH